MPHPRPIASRNIPTAVIMPATTRPGVQMGPHPDVKKLWYVPYSAYGLSR